MSSLLVLTALTYRREANQRVHLQVRHLVARFSQITVVSLTRALRRNLGVVRESGYIIRRDVPCSH